MALKQPRHVLVFLLALTTAFGVIAASPSAEQILDKTAKAMTSAKSVTVKFGYTAGGNHSNGSMTMSGKKFTFNLGNIAVWYNGTLQWALNRSDNEVTLTKPTAAEVVESNPFAILTSYKQRYTPSLTKKQKANTSSPLGQKERRSNHDSHHTHQCRQLLSRGLDITAFRRVVSQRVRHLRQ